MNTINNIILDLGGVVLDIDYNRTIEAFRSLGIKDADNLYSKAQQDPLFDRLEKGMISEKEFYDGMRTLSGVEMTDLEIERAWNAILIALRKEIVDFLSDLKKSYRLFLLSNTNSIHERGYRKMITDAYGSFVLDDLFERTYLSHHLHMRKPDPEIFEYVIADAGLDRSQTFFIDDSPQHVKSAQRLKIPSHHLQNQTLVEFWKEKFSLKEFTGLK